MIPAHLPIRISLLLLPLFLLSHYSIAADSSQSSSLDPCKRQPFRGRCPAGPNGVQMRSQFVLRYYLRNGECISYPYGHCVNDDNEPRLYRYKEECEDACLGGGGGQRGENGGGDGGREATYATIGPILGKDQTGKPPTKAGDAGGKEETECQRQQRGDNETAGGQREYAFIPECTVDGQFRPLQCEKQPNGECFCVNKSGNELKYSRAKSDQQQKIDCERIASAQSALVQECTGSAEPGPCTGSIQRWHFHQPSGQCRPFNFSGCGANGNNFGSEQSCAQQCIHEQPKCDGGQLPLKDSQGQVVGCGTVNCPPGFLCQANAICCPELASEATQSPPPTEVAGNLVLDKKTVGEGGGGGDVCAMPKDRGPCDQYQMRFYFNRELGECKYFFYGGCEGNGNNFARVEECERACLKKGGHSAELVTTTTTTTSMGTTTTGGAGGEEEEAKKRRTTIGEATTTTGISSSPLAREFVDVEPEPVQSNLASDLDTARNVQRVQPPAPILPANRCQHTKDPGNCAAQFVRWFWNGEARICESFAYTGCQGNGNNFASREECLSICHREVVDIEENVDPLKNICDSEIDPGQCGGIFMRYGFDRRSGECRQFQYGGCGGNGNNFASLADCRRKCVGQPAGEEEEEDHQEGGHQSAKTTLLPSLSPNICEHRMDPGECTGTFQRFGYDQKANRCTKFVYGGCGGNGNNFATIDDCSSACVRVQCRPEPECDLGRCQLVRDGQGCPLCSCPPPRHPPLAPTPPRPDEAAHGQCPPLNVQLCQEPCIIFLNRRGCRECVCPIMPAAANTPIQATPPAPSDSVSMPKSSPRTAPPPPPPLPSQNGPQSPIVAPVAPIPKILGGVSNNAVDALPPPTIPPPPPPPSSSPSPPPPPLPSSAIHQGTVEPIAFGHNEICSQPLDAGASACLRFVQRWFFNADSGHCEPFTYTGCAGNRNHFFSKKECQIYCARFSPSTPPQQQLIALTNASSSSVSPSPSSIVLVPSTLPPVPHPPPPPLSPAVHSPPPVDHHIGLPLLSQQQICSLLPDAGPCQQFVPRWFFNIKSGQCEQFSFGSCRGNPNNFPDRARCEAACHPPLPIGQKVVVNRCIVDKDEGTGGGYNVHWYFNVRNLRCEQFVWQGSGGNDNRFGTEAECKMACARGEGGQETVPAAPELLPRPRNVVPPSQVVDREEAEERSNRVEQQPTIMVQGAPIARTRDMEGNVGMPAPAELIPEEMPSPSPSTLAPPPLPAAMAPNPSSPPSRTSAYSADPLPKVPPKMPENLPPMLGNSPPATIDYRNNIRLPSADAGGHQDSAAVAHGLPNHVPESGKFDEVFGGPKEGGLLSFGPKQSVHLPGVPVCPNGLNAMQYSDGRPVLCLPGMGQCPDKSVCYFNGLDFFCCPNEDDPYDQHVFGGYDGEESKHGYKVGTGLRARLRRQADMGGGFGNSLRFDDKPPPVPQSQARYADSASSSPCDQPLFKGTCQQAILRFFYEPASGRCRHFHFTGCGGNQNNFGTLADCEKTCKKAEEQGGDASPPAPKGPCPGGHLPLGGRNPVLCGDLLDSIGCPAGFICIPGPPSVCCPSSVAESAEIRRKPSIAEPGQMEVQPAFQEASTKKAGGASIAEMNAQLLLCQDGSDPMRNETSGIVVECGAGMGIDGRALCEPGFYCSIDPERNVRFCCPLQAQGAKLGTNSAELLAPHFGRRTPNPGEVLGKGSLPSDQQQRTSRKLGGARHGPAGIGGVGTTEFGHLRLRAARVGKEGEGEESQKLMEPKGLDWPTSEDPFEGIACLQRPAEGRECAKGEPSARSNLQHFYSPADRRCKAFFYRGCGGNGNRFETKAECEKRCGGRR